MRTPHAEKRDMTPVVTLSGGDPERKATLLHDLLKNLEKRLIRTLLVSTDEGTAGILHRVPAACCSDILFLAECGIPSCTGDHAVHSMVTSRYGDYDLILLSRKEQPGSDKTEVLTGPTGQEHMMLSHRLGDECAALVHGIQTLLDQWTASTPVWGCVLIGGHSSRMGRPKHLITNSEGITWAEILCTRLAEHTEEVVLAGRGEIPPSLVHVPRLADIPEAKGPLAGILAAMRWNPRVSWIVSACDMPLVETEGLQWLLHTRKPGVWGAVPRRWRSDRFEPLLAHYDFRSRYLFEMMLQQGKSRISEICDHAKILTPELPRNLAGSWRNCNTPEDLVRLAADQ